MVREIIVAVAFAAAAFFPAAAQARVTHYAPDEAVNIYNGSSDPVVVTIDGEDVCTVAVGGGCTAMLPGPHDESQHAVEFAEDGRSVSDRVSIPDCHWNWNGVKTFTVTDEHVHFECQDNITAAQLVALCPEYRDTCLSVVREGVALGLEDPGIFKECFSRYRDDLTAPDRLGPLTDKIVAFLSQHREVADSEARVSVSVALPLILVCD
ncbi:MAG TPA: hypothetical protein VNF99_05725 [Stellaceae bacterium]|nr:hypothetical protein [Stellaceae bacterium]